MNSPVTQTNRFSKDFLSDSVKITSCEYTNNYSPQAQLININNIQQYSLCLRGIIAEILPFQSFLHQGTFLLSKF